MNVETAKQLGDAMRALRRRRRMTQQQAADAAGISRQYLVGLEAGMANPTWDVVARLAAALEAEVGLLDRRAGDRLVTGDTAQAVVTTAAVDLDELLDAHRDPAGARDATDAGRRLPGPQK